MRTADERAQIRAELDPAQQAERWRSLALRLLDELEAAEAQAVPPLDPVHEPDDYRYWHAEHGYLARMCGLAHNAIDRVTNGQFAGSMLDVKCQQLADAYRSEKDRADRLQNEVETLRAARESLEPVGWVAFSDDDEGPFTFLGDDKPTDQDGVGSRVRDDLGNHTPWLRGFIAKTTCRRVYLAPPQPLEDAQ